MWLVDSCRNQKKPYQDVVKQILRYVKGSIDHGIQYHDDSKYEVVGYCDVDYAGDHNTRRSTTDYVFSKGSGVVSWCSKRQSTMSLSIDYDVKLSWVNQSSR